MTLTIIYLPGISLCPGYLRTGATVITEEQTEIEGSSTRGNIRSKQARRTMDNWTAREESDCMVDAATLISDLVTSLNSRKSCLNKALIELSKCLDFESIIKCMVGVRDKSKCPYNKVTLATFGKYQFEKFIDHVSNLKHVEESDLTIDKALAPELHASIKNGIASML